jgi:hypothetical protein
MAAFVVAVPYTQPSGMERFVGTWIATVEHNRSIDTYSISFSIDGRCKVKLSNDTTEQETMGNWSFDGTMFKLNAAFKNVGITYQNNIQWMSVLTFNEGNKAFNILGRAAIDGPQTRITFYKQENVFDYNEKAVPAIINILTKHIPLNSQLAVVSVAAPDPNEGAYYLDELTLQLVNTRSYIIVDRSDIDKILTEQNFQMSGYVDDNTFVSIGKFIGARVVITGNISDTGLQKRLVVKAIDVQTTEILAMVSELL